MQINRVNENKLDQGMNRPCSRHRLKITNKAIQIMLRKAVDDLGWSDSQVARSAGHPQSTIYRLLNAKTANPPFALVYDVCQTLGIALPFSDGADGLTAPITVRIGMTDVLPQKTERVHILPTLKNLIVGKVYDDCASSRYPQGSLLFLSYQAQDLHALKPEDIVLVRIETPAKKQRYFVPMMVMNAPDQKRWIAHHLTDNPVKQHIYSIDKTTFSGRLEKTSVNIVGVVRNALI